MTSRLVRHCALATAVVGLGAVLSLNAQLPVVPYNFTADSTFNWMVGGSVSAVERVGSTLFIGGEFRGLAPRRNLSGGFVALSAASGRRVFVNPFVNGEVHAVLSDGTVWYVAGHFNRIGNTQKDHIVRLTSTGLIDSSFTARVVGRVRTLAIGSPAGVTGRVLYVGGEFTQAGVGASLQNVQNLAAFNIGFGSVTPALLTGFTPAPDAAVYALAPYPATTTMTRLYVGGEFTTIGGAGRYDIAEVNPVTGVATAWNPSGNGRVMALAPTPDGLTVFAGGDFRSFGGTSRDYVAALDAASGLVTTWNPQANGRVRALLISGSNVFAGGDFSLFGGLARERLALVNTVDGSAVSTFDAPANEPVHALALNGPSLIVGGEFTTFGGRPRLHLGAVNAATGAVADWNPSLNDTVQSLAVVGSGASAVVGAGGEFDAFGAVARRNLAAVNLETGEVLSWRPAPNGPVYAFTTLRSSIDGRLRLYVGGDFTRIDGQTRGRGADYVLPLLQLGTWDPQANGAIRTIAIGSRTPTTGPASVDFYAGGDFTSAFGQASSRIAYQAGAGGSPCGSAATWTTGADARVLEIVPTGPHTYVAGAFTSLLGQTANYLARVDCTTGAVDTAWNPNPNGEVRAVEVGANSVYAGGVFSTIGGQTRANIGAVDKTSGVANQWQPNPNGPVNAMELDGTTLYTGGAFTLVSPGRPTVRRRPRLVGLDTTAMGPDALYVSSFAPRWIGQVLDLDFDPGGIAAVGDGEFEGEEDEPVSRVAFFPRLINVPPRPPTDLSASVTGNLTGPSPLATVTLRWSPPVLGARPDRFVLEAGTTPGGTQISGGINAGTGNSQSFANVPAGTYYLRARAQNAQGTSEVSAETVVTVNSSCNAPVDPPSDLVATVAGSLLSLSWTPASGGTISGYRIEAGMAPGSSQYQVPVNATDASYSVSVPPGVYYARVRALATCGDSLTSNEVQIIVGGATPPPGAPQDFGGSVTGNTVTLGWSAPGGQTGYQLEAGSAPGSSNIAVLTLGNVTTFSTAGVPSGNYFLRVRARNAAGLGPASEEFLLVVP